MFFHATRHSSFQVIWQRGPQEQTNKGFLSHIEENAYFTNSSDGLYSTPFPMEIFFSIILFENTPCLPVTSCNPKCSMAADRNSAVVSVMKKFNLQIFLCVTVSLCHTIPHGGTRLFETSHTTSHKNMKYW